MGRRLVAVVTATLTMMAVMGTADARVGPGGIQLDRASVRAGQSFVATASCPADADRTTILYTSAGGTVEVDSETTAGQQLQHTFAVPVVAPGNYDVIVKCSDDTNASTSTASKPITVLAGEPAGWIAVINEPVITDDVVRFSGRCFVNNQPAATVEAIVVDRATLPGTIPIRSSMVPGPNGSFTITIRLPTEGGDFRIGAWCDDSAGTRLAWIEHAEPILYDSGFYDVPDSAFYVEAVEWANECSISQGTGPFLFSPDRWVTRVELVVLLHRLAGSPAATNRTPFTDLTGFGNTAVAWAYASGITKGITPTLFGPNLALNRGQVVTLLWRYEGSIRPSIKGSGRFGDVEPGTFYDEAVGWAVESLVTAGTTPRTFSADDFTTRGQIITFLARMRNYECMTPPA